VLPPATQVCEIRRPENSDAATVAHFDGGCKLGRTRSKKKSRVSNAASERFPFPGKKVRTRRGPNRLTVKGNPTTMPTLSRIAEQRQGPFCCGCGERLPVGSRAHFHPKCRIAAKVRRLREQRARQEQRKQRAVLRAFNLYGCEACFQKYLKSTQELESDTPDTPGSSASRKPRVPRHTQVPVRLTCIGETEIPRDHSATSFLRSDTEAEPQTNRGEVQTRRCFAAQLATRKNGPLTKKVLD